MLYVHYQGAVWYNMSKQYGWDERGDGANAIFGRVEGRNLRNAPIEARATRAIYLQTSSLILLQHLTYWCTWY